MRSNELVAQAHRLLNAGASGDEILRGLKASAEREARLAFAVGDRNFESLVKRVAELFAEAKLAGLSLKELYSAAAMRLGEDSRFAGPPSRPTGQGVEADLDGRYSVSGNPSAKMTTYDKEAIRSLGHTPDEVQIAMTSTDSAEYEKRTAAHKETR